MLYKPKFCNDCGEKIEYENFGILSTRRFCENCETDLRSSVLLPRFGLTAVALLSSLFAIGSILKTPEKTLLVNRRAASEVTNRTQPLSRQAPSEAGNSASPTNGLNEQSSVNRAVNIDHTIKKTPEAQPLPRVEEKPVYFCGAQTKKGTACTRRVKTKDSRCWQHIGEAALPQKEISKNKS